MTHTIDDLWELQWGRNFIVAEISFWAARVCLSLYLLQWGRNFIVAEMSESVTRNAQRFRLQWGRNFIVAEMQPAAMPSTTLIPL